MPGCAIRRGRFVLPIVRIWGLVFGRAPNRKDIIVENVHKIIVNIKLDNSGKLTLSSKIDSAESLGNTEKLIVLLVSHAVDKALEKIEFSSDAIKKALIEMISKIDFSEDDVDKFSEKLDSVNFD